MTIFVVIRDISYRRALCFELKINGYKVEDFNAPEIALESIKLNKSISHVISDLSFADRESREGIWFSEKILDINSSIKVIILTEFHSALGENAAKKAGETVLLEKGVTTEELIKHL